jgi:hypothetical protein
MASNFELLAASRAALRVTLMAVMFVALSARAHAANNCPWINEATASGIIGAEAVGSYTDPTPSQPAVCNFVQSGPSVTRTLRITVLQTPHFQDLLQAENKTCTGTATPMVAIGNEAIACSADDRRKLFAERVVGRVRDQVFTITLGTTQKDDSILNRFELKTRIATAAEQVSGNLF